MDLATGSPDAARVGGPLLLASQICGWGYFACWAVSMYPQPLSNARRRSVRGFSFDYILLFTFGFVAVAIYTVVFYFDPGVQAEYSRRNNGLKNLVVTTDLFNACHSLAIAILTLIQCWIYDHDPLTLHLWVKLFVGLSTLLAIALAMYIGSQHLVHGPGLHLSWALSGDLPADPLPPPMPPPGNPNLDPSPPSPIFPDWIDLLYYFSTIKLIVTCIQNLPQLYLNMVRKSTQGWAVDQVWLDAAGAVLSLVQLFIDAAAENKRKHWLWAGIIGNPAKLGMGALSILFDIMFLVQHYILYAHTQSPTAVLVPGSPIKAHALGEEPVEDLETDPLLQAQPGPPILVSAATATQTSDARRTLPRTINTAVPETIQGPLGARIAFSPPDSASLRPEAALETPTRYGTASVPSMANELLRRKSVVLAESLVGSADFKGVSWRDVLRRQRTGSDHIDQGEGTVSSSLSSSLA
ncbi:hypothetical protein DFJ74DRAFT_691700 [Hyaloraphidium curvatum]|nr:hypothetical protein DFJ74DRAFT_691700 [Hyaloraphidium curvatum]